MSVVASRAEALSWISGDMTRYSTDAVPDHNRWSWRGDGHGERVRDEFRRQARELLGWWAGEEVPSDAAGADLRASGAVLGVVGPDEARSGAEEER